MKRKLISFDAFAKIKNESLSGAAYELNEAASYLSKALDQDLSLVSFGVEDVVYETADGSYVHANYRIQDKKIYFENIEELVIDEESEHQEARKKLGGVIDALQEGDKALAEHLLNEYLDLPYYKRVIKEGRVRRRREHRDAEGKGTGKYYVGFENTTPRTKQKPSIAKKRGIALHKKAVRRPDSEKKQREMRRNKIKLPGLKAMKEWMTLAENALGFVDYQYEAPVLRSSDLKSDDRGNVVALRIPAAALRTEQRIKDFARKALDKEDRSMRFEGKGLCGDVDYCKAVSQLKRQNALSDNDGLQESLEAIVSQWPSVLYLTQSELSECIKVALETTNATNYDDQTCDFMAEGILRTAHEAYVDRVGKILKHAGVREIDGEDKYVEFQKVVNDFFPRLDEAAEKEMQVYVDLYEAIREVYAIAEQQNERTVTAEASTHLSSLHDIISLADEPNADVAQAAAEWLKDLVETNLGDKPWAVSNTPHITVTGDHPAMHDKARQGYTPAGDFSADYGDTAPVSDGKSYRGGGIEMRNRSWGQEGGNKVYPSINNPYTPKPFGDYKIKGETEIDQDSNRLAQWATDATWPDLQNPYIPKGETPSTYKMKNGGETDLVVEK